MGTVPWWQTAVIYQIYPSSYQDTTSNGVGDLAGITSRLDYLTDLGIDAIWISPFFRSPMADFGYDVSDYCDVDPRFGTMADFDILLVTAHANGIRVIIDWVPNHSSDQHPWFIDSRSSRLASRRDWYIWRSPDDTGAPPNNWLSVFGGSAWELDDTTDQYYLHKFLREQPDLNWRNPEVVAAMHETLRFWLDRGVDGFRVDVAHYILKDPALRDNPPSDLANHAGTGQDLGSYDAQLHIHDKGHPDTHAAFRRIRSLLDEYDGDRFSVGEIHIFDWEQWASYYGQDDELHMPFNFTLIYAPWDAASYRTLIDKMEAVLPHGAWPNVVLGNHDETRLATRIGDASARVAAMALLTLRGTPTMYYGDEIGMLEAEVPPGAQRDPWTRTTGATRDGCRTPMQWEDIPGAGFSDSDVDLWLPLGPERTTRNVAAQRQSDTSLLALYRRLLHLRRATPALHLGDYRSLPSPADVFAFERHSEGSHVAVVLNFGSESRTLPGIERSEILLATTPSAAVFTADGLRLAGHGGAIVATAPRSGEGW